MCSGATQVSKLCTGAITVGRGGFLPLAFFLQAKHEYPPKLRAVGCTDALSNVVRAVANRSSSAVPELPNSSSTIVVNSSTLLLSACSVLAHDGFVCIFVQFAAILVAGSKELWEGCERVTFLIMIKTVTYTFSIFKRRCGCTPPPPPPPGTKGCPALNSCAAAATAAAALPPPPSPPPETNAWPGVNSAASIAVGGGRRWWW